MANERKPLDELLADQEAARRAVVRHAFEHTKFYREFYGRAGFELGDIGSDGWFEKLPIVTKRNLRENFDDFIDHAQRAFLKISTTGGSTGTPTRTGYDGRLPDEVYSWRLQSRFGVHPWDDHAYVWRDTRPDAISKIKNAALWWPTRHLKLDATLLSEESIASFIGKYNRIRPALLQGYVGAVSLVAKFIVDHGMEASRGDFPCKDNHSVASPKVVWTTSAPVSAVQRQLIERAFGAPVCDEYGSCELRWIASQCAECKGLHLNVEHVHIEFVDDANLPVPVGEYGRTLLTNLEDTVFPLIRYENNDRGRWLPNQCPCGRTLPCMDSVKGREVECFVLPSGRVINGEYLTTIFDARPELVLGFRSIQHRDLSITIEYVPAGDETEIKRMLESFASRLGGEVPVEFRRVDNIVHDKGKLRFVVREQ